MRLVGHEARMEETKNTYKTLLEKPEANRSFYRLGADGIIL
jgi:hypothetical protein